MKKAPRVKLPPVSKGYRRNFVQCKQLDCDRVYTWDYVPYSLSNPVVYTECGHSIGHRDHNLREITEAAFHRLRVKELHVISKRNLAARLE